MFYYTMPTLSGFTRHCRNEHTASNFYEGADMQTIAEFMSAGHHACDEAFAIAEQAALANSWSEAETAFNKFRTELARHFRMEEDKLFPPRWSPPAVLQAR
jgi:hypothetical protein